MLNYAYAQDNGPGAQDLDGISLNVEGGRPCGVFRLLLILRPGYKRGHRILASTGDQQDG